MAGLRTPLAILYRAPESRVGEAFLQRVRADRGDRVTQVRAEGPAVRQLFKRLKDGGVVGILPDQQPKAGDGEFAPFFGVPRVDHDAAAAAGRAQRRGGAVRVLRAHRLVAAVPPAHRGGAGRDRRDTIPPSAWRRSTPLSKRIARRDPAQYQWTYKRYTLQPPGSVVDNPYRDLERH